MTTTQLVNLIAAHTHGLPSTTTEPDMRPTWAMRRQVRFNTEGLPRGLAKVA